MKAEDLSGRALDVLRLHLSGKVTVGLQDGQLRCSARGKETEFYLLLPGQHPPESQSRCIPFDYIFSAPEKIAALISGKLGLNKSVFARKCDVVQIEKSQAKDFIEKYHVLGYATSAWNIGLQREGKLTCIASFSKGRKMQRLADNERSFELIRFCCLPGYTVSGGLSKLAAAFCRQKNAAEIMTYVDRQFSDGRTFVAAGFSMLGYTPPMKFNIDPRTFTRSPATGDNTGQLQIWNAGNIKMLYRCR